jgi:hypothetical protein
VPTFATIEQETPTMPLKKTITVRGADAAYLTRLSKAALIDVLVEQLRLGSGECDTPLTAEAVRSIVEPTLRARGDVVAPIQARTISA